MQKRKCKVEAKQMQKETKQMHKQNKRAKVMNAKKMTHHSFLSLLVAHSC